LSDSSNPQAKTSTTIAVPAVFVPDGQTPPPEFATLWNPLRIRATYDPTTGVLTADDPTGRGIVGTWCPDAPDQSNPADPQ
jgi:hypothetical protein